MNVLQNRANRSDEILQGKFIRSKLKEVAQEIDKSQKKAISGFKSSFWHNNVFNVSDNQMTLLHDNRERFVDMRTRLGKSGNRNKKKNHPIHNKIIWSQYNYLTRQLAYGYTEAVKEELRQIKD